jgi:hypothetical protein
MDWRTFRHYHKSFIGAFAIIVAALLAADGWLLYKRVKYQREIARLRAGMTEVERRKTDLALASEQNRMQTMLALMRRQAKLDKEIHLAVSVDSAKMYLEREGAVLREFAVRVGAEKRVGIPPDTVHMAVPRGARQVQRVLDRDDGWEVPKWVYADRGLPTPADRTVKGALGSTAILLSGGAVIYTLPSAGPLNDSTYVLPGGIRAGAADLRAIAPNLKPGTVVYFY